MMPASTRPRSGMSTRRTYLDLLKLLAMFYVLFLHSGEAGVLFYADATGSPLFPFYLAFALLSRIAIPLFYMISGALLLGREESLRSLYGRRVPKYLLWLLLGSVCNYLYTCLRLNPQPLSLELFLKILYSSNHAISLWFVYQYLAYLLMLPLLRAMVRGMKLRDYLLVCGFFGLSRLRPVMEYFLFDNQLHLEGNIYLFTNITYITFPLFGFGLSRLLEQEELRKKAALPITLAGILGLAANMCLTVLRCRNGNNWQDQSYTDVLTYLMSIAVFYWAGRLEFSVPFSPRARRILASVSGTSLGFLMLEQIYRKETRPLYLALKPFIRTLPACLVWLSVALVLGILVTLAAQKLSRLALSLLHSSKE